MRRFTLGALAVLTAFCLFWASTGRAWGYVDPGSGLLALQGFATAMAGVLYYMRRRLMALFGRQKPAARKPAARKRDALGPAPEQTGKAA